MSFVCVRQPSKLDCGVACLATIFEHHGRSIPFSQIRKSVGVNARGSTVHGILNAANEFGFNARAIKGTGDALLTGFTLPCIAHVVMRGYADHFIVIHSISQETIIIADPASGIIRLKYSEFVSRSRNGFWAKMRTVKYQWSGVIILAVPRVKC